MYTVYRNLNQFQKQSGIFYSPNAVRRMHVMTQGSAGSTVVQKMRLPWGSTRREMRPRDTTRETGSRTLLKSGLRVELADVQVRGVDPGHEHAVASGALLKDPADFQGYFEIPKAIRDEKRSIALCDDL